MWWYAVVFIVGLVAAYSTIPKPEARKPAGLDDFNVPTAEVGREIPVLFGTRLMSGPNIVWYGDLRITPVQKKGGKK